MIQFNPLALFNAGRRLTIALLAMLLTTLIVFLSSAPVQADTLASTPDLGYRDGVASMYNEVKAAPNTPTNRAFKDVLDQLFQPNAIQVPFRFVNTSGAQQSVVTYSGNIYFSQGQLFINYDKTGNDEAFATIDGKLYTWKVGSQEGEILQRFKGDTLGFLMYMVDPAALMRSIYSDFLEQPNQFTTTTAQGIQTIQFKQGPSGFKGIQIVVKPFWLKALVIEQPSDKPSSDQPSSAAGQNQGRLEIDPPIALDTLPEGLAVLPKGVKFKPSKASLRNRMTYL